MIGNPFASVVVSYPVCVTFVVGASGLEVMMPLLSITAELELNTVDAGPELKVILSLLSIFEELELGIADVGPELKLILPLLSVVPVL